MPASMISKVKSGILIPVCVALAVVFGADQVHSGTHPNMAKGAVEEEETAASGPGAAGTQAAEPADAGTEAVGAVSS